MCIITLEDKEGQIDISATKIFARHTEPGYQLIIYGMSIATDSSAAMILPIPIKPESGEDAIRFIDMDSAKDKPNNIDHQEDQPVIISNEPRNFFDELENICHSEYIPEPSLRYSDPFGDAFGSNTDISSVLKVHEIGDYEASYIPSKDDFNRLNKCFRLETKIWDKLPNYNQYGFVVFQLKTSKDYRKKSDIPPMAFEFPTSEPYKLFFPTIHVHGNEDYNDLSKADFDHTLYCQRPNARAEFKYQRDLLKQKTPTPARNVEIIYKESKGLSNQYYFRGYPWFLSSEANSFSSALNDFHNNIIDSSKKIVAMNLKGSFKNRDIWLEKKVENIAINPVKNIENNRKILILSTQNKFDLRFVGEKIGDSISIGRDKENTWVLEGEYISRNHALIFYLGDQYMLIDTSSNGLFINDSNIPLGISNKRKLQEGDLLRIDRHLIKVKFEYENYH